VRGDSTTYRAARNQLSWLAGCIILEAIVSLVHLQLAGVWAGSDVTGRYVRKTKKTKATDIPRIVLDVTDILCS